MKQLALFIVFLIAFSACKEKEEDISYAMNIVLKNSTNKKIKIEVLPKSPYNHSGNSYVISEGCSCYRDNVQTIEPNTEHDLFRTSTLTYKPVELLNNVFENFSITISPDTIAEFSPTATKNYKYNPYTDTSAWHYRKHTEIFPENGSSFQVVFDTYTFEIKPENIVKQ